MSVSKYGIVYLKKRKVVFKINYVKSTKHLNWVAVIDLKTCFTCVNLNGKIYLIGEVIENRPPVHDFCRCLIEEMNAVYPGGATNDGFNGADYYLYQNGSLPDYYITVSEATLLGWKSWLGNLAIVAPGKMLTKGLYENREEKLPIASGRIWYEADINYSFGFRGSQRILFSNDGLVFVTYDHYSTFVEVIGGFYGEN
ncbi:MAG: ribonuclease domain-containing protein [Clostridia bacterium]